MVLFTPMSGRLPNDIDVNNTIPSAVLLYWIYELKMNTVP